jgi:IS1 family transposase/transposase-like protein
MTIQQSFNCPHCLSAKVVKNGLKKSGVQNYRCQTCGKQFQEEYLYWGAKKENKDLVSRMLIRGSGIRDISDVLRISTGCVLRVLLSYLNVELKPKYRFYHQVQVDELYSFVQSKKKKVWILYAYCAQTNEILALTMGKRSKKTVKDLYKRLKDIQVNFWCTDAWKAFKEVFPADSHLIGKRFTKAIEGVNTSLRNTCKRLIRRTTAFSKKLINHWCAVKLVMASRNLKSSYI